MTKIDDIRFKRRLYELGHVKNINGYTWQDIADILVNEFNDEFFAIYITGDYCRRSYSRLCSVKPCNEKCEDLKDNTDHYLNNVLASIKKERVKLSDEVTQNNAYIRQLAREDTLKEIAREYAEIMYKGKILDKPRYCKRLDSNNEAILQISDWHYGIEVDNFCNTYNPSVCIERVNKLQQEVIKICNERLIKKLHIVNLSDLISGYIHLTLRLQNRYDVITQVMDVAEILAEFMNNLSTHVDIEYYDCLDNHSRLDPNKKDSINLESLVRIIHWYLVERFKNNDKININNCDEYGGDIIEFWCNGHLVAGVHGDNDSLNNVVERLSMMTDSNYDLILTAHNHHFAATENNNCIVLQNGSLMGTDYYATKLRKKSIPSQNLIVVCPENVTDSVYRIIFN